MADLQAKVLTWNLSKHKKSRNCRQQTIRFNMQLNLQCYSTIRKESQAQGKLRTDF